MPASDARHLLGKCAGDRGRYIAAALTICRAYIIAGRPNPAPRLASFEGWSDTVRSALIWLDRADPCETMEQARAEDPQLVSLRELLVAWADDLGVGKQHARTAADVLKLVRGDQNPGAGAALEFGDNEVAYPALREAVLAVASSRGRPNARTLGHWFKRHKGRIVVGLRICGEADAHGHAVQWWIDKVENS